MQLRRVAILAGGSAVVLGLALALPLAARLRSDSASVAAIGSWTDVYAAHLDQLLVPDGEYKLVTDVYQRHGPADALMRASETYLPERHTETKRLIFAADGSLSAYRFEIVDRDGNVLGRVSFSGLDEEALVQDYRGNGKGEAQFVPAPAAGPKDIATLKEELVGRHRSLVASLLESSSREVEIATVGTRVVVSTPARLPRITDGSRALDQGYTIPYVRDLQPVSAYLQREFDSRSMALIRTSMWVVDGEGRETLVASATRREEGGN